MPRTPKAPKLTKPVKIMTDIVRLSKVRNGLIPDIKTKMNKLLWARSKSTPIGFRHDSANLRACMLYNEFREIDCPEVRVRDFPHGIIVIAPPSIVDSQDEPDRFLLSRLGTNEPVSCVIGIEGKGLRENKEKASEFIAMAKEKGWSPTKTSGGKRSGSSRIHNSGWTGHYFVSLQGAGNDGVEIGCDPLANHCLEYADDETIFSVTCQLLFMMLKCVDAGKLLKDPSTLTKSVETLQNLCETHDLLDFSRFPTNPLNADGVLCCWSGETITADSFLGDSSNQKYAQKCHIDSVANAKIKFDKNTGKLVTLCRPYNFMWGMRWANLLQSQGSMQEALERMGKTRIAELEKENAELRRQLANVKTV